VGHVAHIGEMRNSYGVDQKTGGKRSLEQSRRR